MEPIVQIVITKDRDGMYHVKTMTATITLQETIEDNLSIGSMITALAKDLVPVP